MFFALMMKYFSAFIMPQTFLWNVILCTYACMHTDIQAGAWLRKHLWQCSYSVPLAPCSQMLCTGIIVEWVSMKLVMSKSLTFEIHFVFTHTCTHTRTHAHVHTHIHTHTHNNRERFNGAKCEYCWASWNTKRNLKLGNAQSLVLSLM